MNNMIKAAMLSSALVMLFCAGSQEWAMAQGGMLAAPQTERQNVPPDVLPPEFSDHFILRDSERVWLDINREAFGIPGTTMVDMEKFDAMLAKLSNQVRKQPVNAMIGSNGAIIPGIAGYQLDSKKLMVLFFHYFYDSGAGIYEVPLAPLYPTVDSELLSEIRVKPIGSYVTYYNARNKNRSHNVALAAKAIDNVVIFPGERFSFNQTVGIRTRARGYLQAPIIVRGELAEGIGGGICQVSSTLFNATDRAGLKIIERYSHSRRVPYVLAGRDATVSWGGPDFTFENCYNQPILIKAAAYAGSMHVALYSSENINFNPREVRGIGKKLPQEVKNTNNL